MDVRLLTMMMRRPQLDRGEFLQRWNAHVQIVRQHAPSLGIRRYVRLRSVPFSPVNLFMRWSRGTMPRFDGVDVWWADRNEFFAKLSTSEGQRALDVILASACEHADFARSAQWVAREHVLREGKTSARPLVWAGRGLTTLSREEFQTYYLERHGPLVSSYAELVGIDRYVQVHYLDDALNDVFLRARERVSGTTSSVEPFPVSAEITWDLAPMFRRETARESRNARAAIAEDEQRHIDFSRSSIWLCDACEGFSGR